MYLYPCSSIVGCCRHTYVVVYMIKVSIFILLVYIYHLTCEEEHIEGTWSVCNVIQDIT